MLAQRLLLLSQKNTADMVEDNIFDKDIVQLGREYYNEILQDGNEFTDEEFVEFACWLAHHRRDAFFGEISADLNRDVLDDGVQTVLTEGVADRNKIRAFAREVAQSPTTRKKIAENREIMENGKVAKADDGTLYIKQPRSWRDILPKLPF